MAARGKANCSGPPFLLGLPFSTTTEFAWQDGDLPDAPSKLFQRTEMGFGSSDFARRGSHGRSLLWSSTDLTKAIRMPGKKVADQYLWGTYRSGGQHAISTNKRARRILEEPQVKFALNFWDGKTEPRALAVDHHQWRFLPQKHGAANWQRQSRRFWFALQMGRRLEAEHAQRAATALLERFNKMRE